MKQLKLKLYKQHLLHCCFIYFKQSPKKDLPRQLSGMMKKSPELLKFTSLTKEVNFSMFHIFEIAIVARLQILFYKTDRHVLNYSKTVV